MALAVPGSVRCLRPVPTGRQRTLWLLDRAAANQLPRGLERVASPDGVRRSALAAELAQALEGFLEDRCTVGVAAPLLHVRKVGLVGRCAVQAAGCPSPGSPQAAARAVPLVGDRRIVRKARLGHVPADRYVMCLTPARTPPSVRRPTRLPRIASPLATDATPLQVERDGRPGPSKKRSVQLTLVSNPRATMHAYHTRMMPMVIRSRLRSATEEPPTDDV